MLSRVNRPCDEPTTRTKEELCSIFLLADKWDFARIRAWSLSRLEAVATDVDKIVFGKQYGIDRWLLDAFYGVCVRREPITDEEGERLGLSEVLRIYRAREQMRSVDVCSPYAQRKGIVCRTFGPIIANLRRGATSSGEHHASKTCNNNPGTEQLTPSVVGAVCTPSRASSVEMSSVSASPKPPVTKLHEPKPAMSIGLHIETNVHSQTAAEPWTGTTTATNKSKGGEKVMNTEETSVVLPALDTFKPAEPAATAAEAREDDWFLPTPSKAKKGKEGK
jgi:hypothetical protein